MIADRMHHSWNIVERKSVVERNSRLAMVYMWPSREEEAGGGERVVSFVGRYLHVLVSVSV